MVDETIEKAVKEVLSQIPDADEDMVRQEFLRYQVEFIIPPQDAMRSVLRKVQTKAGIVASTQSEISAAPVKKVERLSELGPEEKNIGIEVKIVTHNPVTQAVRGQDRDIAFGTLVDNPWGNGEGTKWDYKDWGPSPNIRPGAIVRLEGCSVNEYQGKRSLNINQSSRVVVLQEGSANIADPTEPLTIVEAAKMDGMVSVIARVISAKNDVITRRDGSGTIKVVRGKIADDTGTIGFLSWEPFEHKAGDLLKIDSATVRRFRDTPELNFGRTTKIEIFHDANFPDSSTLEDSSILTISQLRDGSRDVTIIAQLQSLTERTFTNSDGEDKTVFAGQLIDPTGQCKSSMWCDVGIAEDELPIVLRIENARIRSWQGIPDVTIDNVEQVIRIDQKPWDNINVENHVVEASMDELATSGSRVGITTTATVVSIRNDCGIIWRCPECRRTLREDNCQVHGAVQGERDIRLRISIDDGEYCGSLIAGKDATLAYLETDMTGFEEMVSEMGQFEFAQSLRNRLLGRKLAVTGRTIVDEQGMTLIAEGLEIVDVDPSLSATEARAKWGLV